LCGVVVMGYCMVITSPAVLTASLQCTVGMLSVLFADDLKNELKAAL